jgi:pimeloyl-ACP methyl ester carboxylesterase
MTAPQFSEPTNRWLASGEYVTAAGLETFVYERGSGPVIIFLHGFPTSCYDWREIIDALSGSHRCIAFDFPGYGLSDKPVAYSYSLFQQADVAVAVARSLGISEAHLVGHDVGQSIHAELLAREQEGSLPFRVLSSTILNGSTLQGHASIRSFQKLLGSNETLPQAIAALDGLMQTYIPALKALMKRPDCLTSEDETVMQELLEYRDGHKRLAPLSGYMRERLIHQDRWIGAFKAAKHPMQIVWADGDPVANVEMGRELSKIVSQAVYTELKDLGHFLILEDPLTVARRIAEFIGSPLSY